MANMTHFLDKDSFFFFHDCSETAGLARMTACLGSAWLFTMVQRVKTTPFSLVSMSCWRWRGTRLPSCRIWTCRCFQALFATTRESPKLRVRVPVWRWATQSSSYMKLWEAPGTTRAKSSLNRSSSCRLAGSTLIITSRSNSQSLCSRSGEESFKGNISYWLSSHGSELNKWNGKKMCSYFR